MSSGGGTLKSDLQARTLSMLLGRVVVPLGGGDRCMTDRALNDLARAARFIRSGDQGLHTAVHCLYDKEADEYAVQLEVGLADDKSKPALTRDQEVFAMREMSTRSIKVSNQRGRKWNISSSCLARSKSL